MMNNAWRLTALSIALLALMSRPALAADSMSQATDLIDLSLEELVQIKIPTVVGASKYEQSAAQAPSSVSVITAEEIKAYGWIKLSDVLRSVRGFHATNDRNYEFFGVRGFGLPGDYSSRVLLLIDGLRINDAIYQQATAGGDFPLDLDLVERIEIIRGPGSALYGSSAFFAVINVIPKRGADFQSVEASIGGGDLSTQFGRLTFGKKYESGLNVLVSGSGFDQDRPGPYVFSAFAQDPALNNGVSDQGNGERWKSYYASAQYGDFTFQAGAGKRDKHVSTGIYGTVFNDARTVTYDAHQFFDLQYRHALSETSELSARVYQQRYDYWAHYVFDYPPLTENQDSLDNQWWGGELRYVTKLGARHRLTLGTEYVDHYQADQSNFDLDPAFTYFDSRESFTSWGIYAQDEITLTDKLTLNLGIRYDDVYGGTSSTNPRLGLIYSPGQETAIKFLYGSAFRAANSFERYYVTSISKVNPNLQPETIKTVELALEHSFNPHLRGTASVYQYRLDDLITQITDPADGLDVFQNTSKVDARGLDLELQAKWSRLEGRVSYTYQETENKETGQTLPNSPKHMLKLNLIAPVFRDKLALGFETQTVASRNNVNGESVPGYTIANVNLVGRNWVKGLEISAGVFNLFDKEYGDPSSNDYDAAVLSIPQDGRTFRAKLTYRF